MTATKIVLDCVNGVSCIDMIGDIYYIRKEPTHNTPLLFPVQEQLQRIQIASNQNITFLFGGAGC